MLCVYACVYAAVCMHVCVCVPACMLVCARATGEGGQVSLHELVPSSYHEGSLMETQVVSLAQVFLPTGLSADSVLAFV